LENEVLIELPWNCRRNRKGRNGYICAHQNVPGTCNDYPTMCGRAAEKTYWPAIDQDGWDTFRNHTTTSTVVAYPCGGQAVKKYVW
jgi:hypothetical protein